MKLEPKPPSGGQTKKMKPRKTNIVLKGIDHDENPKRRKSLKAPVRLKIPREEGHQEKKGERAKEEEHTGKLQKR
jgi:hypothetical protein